MEESKSLGLPLTLFNSESSEESASKNGNNNFSNSNMTRTAVVPKDATKEHCEPNSTAESR